MVAILNSVIPFILFDPAPPPPWHFTNSFTYLLNCIHLYLSPYTFHLFSPLSLLVRWTCLIKMEEKIIELDYGEN